LRRSGRLQAVESEASPLTSAQSGTHVIGTIARASIPPPARASIPPLASLSPPGVSLRPRAIGKTAIDESVHTAALSSIAGFVEASAFLSLFGLFPAHITGALVWAASSVSAPATGGFLVRLSIVPIFVTAVTLAAVVTRLERRRRANPLPLLMSIMTFALATFCAAGVVLGRYATGTDAVALAIVGGAGVFAMGIQNALMRESLNGLCLTTMMTGNLTQFGIEVVNFFFVLADSTPANRGDALREARQRIRRFGAPLAGFMAGAGGGAYLTHAFGLVSIALPTFVCAGLTVAAWRTFR
jgi:uncharacterized membrane protein YoaK (UPF0700 family)